MVASVNVGRSRVFAAPVGATAIDKRPVSGPVFVRAPGRKGASGLVSDEIVSATHHGGDDKAVYAYAREDLDAWAAELGRVLPDGMFGENLTTCGLPVTDAVVGEHWEIGAELVLQVRQPRIPCGTFAARMAEPRWVHTFTRHAVPGAYLRVLRPGPVAQGDPVVVTHRPAHGVTIGTTFRAITLERDLLPLLLDATDLPEYLLARARRRVAPVG